MSGAIPSRSLAAPAADPSPVVLVTQVGAATGSGAAAAALACAASEPDRAALLIDLCGGRAPRPSLIATAGARRLEERLVAHMPDAAVASRGAFCRLTLPADRDAIEHVAAALPLVRESAGIVHLPPPLLRAVLEETRVLPTAVLLRADLTRDRALTALVARDLMAQGLGLVVLKRPLGRLAARAALFGVRLAGDGGLPVRACKLLRAEDSKLRIRYDGKDESRGEREGRPGHSRREPARARRWPPAREGQRRA